MPSDTDGKFHPTAWTPARTALWKALPPSDKRVLEGFVANGSTATVPEQWQELHNQLSGIEQKSAVNPRILKHMRERGWRDNVIESVYGPKPKGDVS